MSITEIILLCSLFASLLLLVVVLIYYKYARKFTRERFAFRVFLLISSLSASLILILLSSKTTFAMTVALAAKMFGLNLAEFEPSLSDKLLAVGLIFALIYFAIKLHRNWPGEISVREYQARLVGLPPGLIGGTIAAVGAISGKAPLEIYSAISPSENSSEFSFSPTQNKVWHQWAARILQLTMNQLHIDELKDWYADQHLFIARYGPKNSILVIACVDEAPADGQFRQVIEFSRQQVGSPGRLIFAINNSGERREVEIDDVKIELRYRDELLSNLVDFSSYKADIEYRYESAEIAEGYDLTIPDVYVASSGFFISGGKREDIENVENYVSDWSTETTLKHLAVLGEYG